MNHWDAALFGQHVLGVGRPERRGDHDGVWVAQVSRVVTDVNLGTELAQGCYVRGVAQVAAGYFVAHADENAGDAAHTRAADADEVHHA